MDDPLAPDPAPIALDVAPEPALPALFGAAIGVVGAGRYLPLFAQWEADGKSRPSWNWAAGLCTFNWMLFRRLWLPAALYAAVLLVVPLLLVGVGRLLLQWSETTELATLLGCAALAFVVPSVLGDALLYRLCRTNITRALEMSPTLEVACSVLRQRAPSRVWLQRQIVINALGLGLLVVIGYLVWPAAPEIQEPVAAPTPIQPATPKMPAASTTPEVAVVAAFTSEAASAPVAIAASAPASASVSALTPVPLPASEPSSAAIATQAVTAPTPPLQAREPAASAATSTRADKGFLINVGLFADPDNARLAYVKLVKAGLPAQREVLLFKSQRVTRVRAGPFASRAKANAAIARIKKMQLDAVLAKP
ncbi:MAG: hypothetical protein AUJ20_01800 [Comamonadaceae bacterium CG1_02_60_18]|nr:MAG: hypothetical protein AUJ20_01800 [Comamonadaceae bacterium CG1_02_60_18]PIQ55592.1 MAG: hypothetical protein COW02_03150 [Comamonadaceae bacterium CG12_big_fil_rev_8_21_14_0_65_59_15]